MTLRRWARVASVAALSVGLITPVATLLGVGLAGEGELFAPLGFSSLDHLTSWQRLLGRGFGVVPSVFVGAALIALGRGFAPVAQGNNFTDELTCSLRRFAVRVGIASFASIICPTVTGLLFSIGTPTGQGKLVIQVGSTAAFGLIASLAVMTVAHLLIEARHLERENAEFV